jgi:hypothetical protein
MVSRPDSTHWATRIDLPISMQPESTARAFKIVHLIDYSSLRLVHSHYNPMSAGGRVSSGASALVEIHRSDAIGSATPLVNGLRLRSPLDSGMSFACLRIGVGNSPSIKERGSFSLELCGDRLSDVYSFA